MSDWWRGAVIYQIYPRSFRDFERRRRRRPQGRDREARPRRFARRRRDLALALLPLADEGLRLRRQRLSRRRSAVRLARGRRRADPARACARAEGDHRPGLVAFIGPARLVRRKPRRAATIRKPIGTCGPTRSPTARRRTIGRRCSAAAPGRGMRGGGNIICTTSCPSSPISTCAIPRCRMRCSTTARFWLERGVDGFRLDVVNFFIHDAQLRDNPRAHAAEARAAAPASVSAPPLRPHAAGDAAVHRAPARAARRIRRDGGWRDRGRRAAEGAARLHGRRRSPAHGVFVLPPAPARDDAGDRDQGSAAQAGKARAAGRRGRSRTTTSIRFPTRLAGDDPQRTKLMLALLLALRGTAFLYQGDELGLPHADVPFERLRDPEAIAFWPSGIGRDGARTPMPWSRDANMAGFTDARRCWLPLDPRHRALAVDAQEGDPSSVLAFTRAIDRAAPRQHTRCAKARFHRDRRAGAGAGVRARSGRRAPALASSISATDPTRCRCPPTSGALHVGESARLTTAGASRSAAIRRCSSKSERTGWPCAARYTVTSLRDERDPQKRRSDHAARRTRRAAGVCVRRAAWRLPAGLRRPDAHPRARRACCGSGPWPNGANAAPDGAHASAADHQAMLRHLPSPRRATAARRLQRQPRTSRLDTNAALRNSRAAQSAARHARCAIPGKAAHHLSPSKH